MRIYLARPITGLDFSQVFWYYQATTAKLREYGYEVVHPFCGKGYLQHETTFKAEGYQQPLSCNNAILARDRWMCRYADVIYANLCGSQKVSIGTCMEIAFGIEHCKHIVVSMEQGNIHRHSFVLAGASVIYDTDEEAVEYLRKLAAMEI